MKMVSIRDVVLLDACVGVFLVAGAIFYFYIGAQSEELASVHKSAPELLANHYYSQGEYAKLRDEAVSCNKFQNEMYVASLRGSAKGASENATVLLGLAAVFLLNAWYLKEVGVRREPPQPPRRDT